MASQKYTRLLLMIAIAATCGLIEFASAAPKKKLTYDEAWAYCKARLDKEKVPTTTTSSNERFTRGGACMKHFGYNL